MSAPSAEEELEPAGGGYYVPLADLLTGLVFILVILLTAVTITSRPEFESQLAIESERDRLARELERLRALDKAYVQPRETARQALITVLERMRDDLRAEGFEVEMDRDAGVLSLRGADLFAGPDESGRLREDRARALAGVVARRLSCVADGAMPRDAGCAGVASARVSRALVMVLSSGASPDLVGAAAARAAVLYGRIVEAAPALTLLRDRLGRPVLGHAGNSQGFERGVRLAIEMERPALPPTNWLNEGTP